MTILSANHLPVIDDQFATLRQNGRESFAAMGLPGHRTEQWKYTPLTALDGQEFVAPAQSGEAVSAFAALTDTVVTINNGSITLPDTLPKGLNIWTADSCPPEYLAQLGAILAPADKPMAAVNLSSFQEVLVVHIARGKMIEAPLVLDFQGFHVGDKTSLHHPRVLILAEAGSALTLVEHHHGSGNYYSNPVIEISLDQDANMRHYKIQEESDSAFHTAVTALETGENVQYEGFLLHKGGKLARHEIHHRANGKHVNMQMNGACLGKGQQHHDFVSFIDLAASDGQCNELYKVVLDDKAKSAFWGKFLVRPDSQKTDARMLCNNLLLSQGAEADAKPELEIYADDVQCAHGATTGQMNMDALFFLRQRGISETDARAILTRGFILEAVENISHQAVQDMVATMIPGAMD